MGVPRLVIAGTHSGVGKTTISTGIMAALTERGLTVQGFKTGPDYIDPSYHTGATGRVSRNLDDWLLGENLGPLFRRAAEGADIAVVEGVMGLFDGIKGQKGRGSSAHIAKLLGAPVILIVDVRSMAYSTAALVHGFADFDAGLNLAGVILNRVGSRAHLEMVQEAVEELGIPVVGHLAREDSFTLPERHLGLVPLGERGCREDYFRDLAMVIEKGIDLDRLIELAKGYGGMPVKTRSNPAQVHRTELSCLNITRVLGVECSGFGGEKPIKIAVARDKAFSFYYQDALDLLADLGAQILPFSPLNDKELPPGTEGVFIGGGFPESFLSELSVNKTMHQSLQGAHARGIPVYAECGGLIYLCRQIVGFDGIAYTGAGLIPAISTMGKKLQGMGYRQGVILKDSILGPRGTTVQGHEFHYSSTQYDAESKMYELSTATGENKGTEGYGAGSLLASYLHLNFAGNPMLAQRFLQACLKQREERS